MRPLGIGLASLAIGLVAGAGIAAAVRPAESRSATQAVERGADCVTGTQDVEFLATGPSAHRACVALRLRIERVIGEGNPSLESGSTINQTTFAHDSSGDAVTVMEVGADNGDINTLAAGVLAADGYSINFGRTTTFRAP
jgi:hypothetical protein